MSSIISRMLQTMIIQKPVYPRTVRRSVNVYWIAMMTMVVRPHASPISRKNTKTAPVRLAAKIMSIYALRFDSNFQDQCPLGCPCDNYQCDLPEKKAILTLNTYGGNPVLIQPNGKHQISFGIKLTLLYINFARFGNFY